MIRPASSSAMTVIATAAERGHVIAIVSEGWRWLPGGGPARLSRQVSSDGVGGIAV